MKIVSIDPGLRNLGVVVLQGRQVVFAGVLDVARQKDTDSVKTRAVYSRLSAIEAVYHCDLCVIEDNNFGRANTNPDNLLVQAAAGATLLSLGAKELLYYQSSFKFSCFFNLTPSFTGKVRNKYKVQSRALAQNLIASYNLTGETAGLAESDHLSDALGLGMCALVRACGRGLDGPRAECPSQPVPVPRRPPAPSASSTCR